MCLHINQRPIRFVCRSLVSYLLFVSFFFHSVLLWQVAMTFSKYIGEGIQAHPSCPPNCLGAISASR